MEFSSKDLKQTAWAAMRAAVPSAVLVALVYYLLSTVLPGMISFITPSYTVDDILYNWDPGMWITVFLSVLLTMYHLVMRFSFRSWCLRTARGQWTGPDALLDGFGMAGRVLLMELQLFLRIFGWALAMAFLCGILSAVLSVLFGGFERLLVVTFSGVAGVAIYLILLRYMLAPYLLWDYPDAGSSAAVRRSVEMMRGHIWQVVKLFLSFWPWFLAQLFLGLAVDAVFTVPLLGQVDLDSLSRAGLAELISQLQLATETPPAVLLGMAVNLVFALFFTPYFEISVANFYRALSLEPVVPAFSGESF